MASRSSVVFCLVLLVASCLVKIEETASTECRCIIGHGCFDGKQAVFQGRHNRKVHTHTHTHTHAMHAQMFVGGSGNGIKEETNEEVGKSGKLLQDEEADDDIMNGKIKLEVGWELRKVPSGPDPLHHNGNAPKKPRTDP